MQRITTSVTQTQPTYDQLTSGIDTIAAGYKGSNLHRLALLELMKSVRAYSNENADVWEVERRLAILIGAYVFVLECIEADKWRIQGSSLRDLIYAVLGKAFVAALDDKLRFIYLDKFKTFVDSSSAAEAVVADLPLKERFKEIQSIMLKRLKSEIKQYSHALPTEKVIDRHLQGTGDAEGSQGIVARYKFKKALPYEKLNKDRLFFAQMAQVIAALHPRRDKEFADMFASGCRVKIGMLIYILQTIDSSRSELYTLCRESLNNNSLSDIHPDIQTVCLLALRNYLSESSTAAAVESKARLLFKQENQLKNLEPVFNNLVKSINASVDANESYGFSTLTMMLAAAGAIVCAVPGIGAGQAGGNSLAKTDWMLRPTNDVAIPLRPPITFFIGNPAGQLIGYYAANQVVTYTLESAVGLACGTLSGMIGLTTGLLVGVTLFEMTPAVLKAICRACVATHQQIVDPVLADKLADDMRIVNILLELPDDLFTDEQKKHFRDDVLGIRAGAQGFFGAPAAAYSIVADDAQLDAASDSVMRY